MLRFESDYLEGHPAIPEASVDSNFEQAPGYRTDPTVSGSGPYPWVLRSSRRPGAF